MKHNFNFIISLFILLIGFSCSKENDVVQPNTAKIPQNLKVEITDGKAMLKWDVRSEESYQFQLAEDEKFADLIFDQSNKKKEADIEIEDVENYINQGIVIFKNIPLNKKFYFRVRSKLIDEKTHKPTSISGFAKTLFEIEDKSKPSIPIQKVEEDKISFASFEVGFPEGFNEQNSLEIQLQVSMNSTFDAASEYYFYGYGAYANDLKPNTEYFYRIIPSGFNTNNRSSETLKLKTSPIPLLENDEIVYLEERGLDHFTVRFTPKEIQKVSLAIKHVVDFKAVTEVSTDQGFENHKTEKQSIPVSANNTPFGMFETVKYLGENLYARSYLVLGDHKGEFSETINKEMENAIAYCSGEHYKFIKDAKSTDRIIYLNNDKMSIKISVPLIQEGQNDLVFNKDSNNNFSVTVGDKEYSSLQLKEGEQFQLTFFKEGNAIKTKELYNGISLYNSDSKERLSLHHFGLGFFN